MKLSKITSFFNRKTERKYLTPLTKEETLTELSSILGSQEKESRICYRIQELGANNSQNELEIATEACQLILDNPCERPDQTSNRLSAYANGFTQQTIRRMKNRLVAFNTFSH